MDLSLLRISEGRLYALANTRRAAGAFAKVRVDHPQSWDVDNLWSQVARGKIHWDKMLKVLPDVTLEKNRKYFDLPTPRVVFPTDIVSRVTFAHEPLFYLKQGYATLYQGKQEFPPELLWYRSLLSGGDAAYEPRENAEAEVESFDDYGKMDEFYWVLPPSMMRDFQLEYATLLKKAVSEGGVTKLTERLVEIISNPREHGYDYHYTGKWFFLSELYNRVKTQGGCTREIPYPEIMTAWVEWREAQ